MNNQTEQEYLETRIRTCLQCKLSINKGAIIPLYCKNLDLECIDVINKNLCRFHDHLED